MSPGRFRQRDKLMVGRLLKFALNVVSELTKVVDALNLHVFHRTPECLSVPESQIFFYFSDRLLIGQSLRQTPAWCVCLCALSACVCECSGCWVQGCAACWSIDLQPPLWSLAFVWQIYLCCRLSFHCHSLTHGSDTSRVLHQWENNMHLWPLELFLLRKAPEKECFSCPRLFKCLPRDTAIETKGWRDIWRQV